MSGTSLQRAAALRRLKLGLLFLALFVAASTVGYMVLGWLVCGEGWGFLDSLFMTIITVTTIGYGDVLGVQEAGHVSAMVYTMAVSLVGMGAALYVVSMATAFVVEGDLHRVLWRRKMSKLIEKMNGHFIICGIGSTGLHVVAELQATGRPFVAIDSSEESMQRMHRLLGEDVVAIVGDATDDEVLRSAGIERAGGLVAALHNDPQNLFLTISGRRLNPRMRIIARGIDSNTSAKLRQAGADSVVSPNLIGGLRMVSEMVRPETVSFLDIMLRDQDTSFRFEDLPIEAGSAADGKSLGDLRLRERFGVVVVAYRASPTAQIDYCPPDSQPLVGGNCLVVLGNADRVLEAKNRVAVAKKTLAH